MKHLKKSLAYGAFEYTIITGLSIVLSLMVLKMVKGKTNPSSFLDKSTAAADNYVSESVDKIEEAVPDTSGIVVSLIQPVYTTTSSDNVSTEVLDLLKTSSIAKDKEGADISSSLEIIQGSESLHGIGQRRIKLRATDKDSNIKEFFQIVILTQEINDDFISNYIKAVTVQMGVSFSTEEDFNTFLSDFLDDEVAGEFIKDTLKSELLGKTEEAQINGNEGPGKIAIPVPDDLIDNIVSKILNSDNGSINLPINWSSVWSRFYSQYPNANNLFVFVNDSENYVRFYYTLSGSINATLVYNSTLGRIVINNGTYREVIWWQDFYTNTNNGWGSSDGFLPVSSTLTYLYSYKTLDYPKPKFNIPTTGLIKSWVSPYTTMQTVTIPIPSDSPSNKLTTTYTEPSKFIYKSY